MTPADDTFLVECCSDKTWLVGVDHVGESRFFRLFAQPIVRMANSPGVPSYSVVGFEVLLRLVEHSRMVGPEAFISIMEDFQLAERFDRLVFEAAVNFLRSYHARIDPNLRVFVNVSGQSINNTGFLGFAEGLLIETPDVAARLCIELTETVAISNFGQVVRFMHRLKARGCRFALDDFGTGFSSFAYLKTLPVDYLKIDGLFIRGIARNQVDWAIVRAINEVSQSMGKVTIAECIENDDTARLLLELGIDLMQGYAISRPVPLNEMLNDAS